MSEPYSTGEVARMLGVSRQTVVRWADEGKIPTFTLPGGKHRRITQSEFRAFAVVQGFAEELCRGRAVQGDVVRPFVAGRALTGRGAWVILTPEDAPGEYLDPEDSGGWRIDVRTADDMRAVQTRLAASGYKFINQP